MEFSVAFNVGDDPKFYYVTNTLTLANIDRIKINPDKRYRESMDISTTSKWRICCR